MPSLATDRSARLRFASAAILIVGLVSAVVIYLRAGQIPGNPLGYDPEDTKAYMRQMELYGGTVNVLASDFRQWFTGLWQGRHLAFTVAVLAALVAGGVRLAAIQLPPLDDEDAPG